MLEMMYIEVNSKLVVHAALSPYYTSAYLLLELTKMQTLLLNFELWLLCHLSLV